MPILKQDGVFPPWCEMTAFSIRPIDEAPRSAPKQHAVVCSEGTVLRAFGHWQSITSSGVFTCRTGTPPTHDSPYAYRKTTGFDNHYHDCDEYWIVVEGHCTVASEGRIYEVGPGDCVATGMGWHHDVVACHDEGGIRAVWLETTLEGRKREGHLWVPTHGEAEPRLDRI